MKRCTMSGKIINPNDEVVLARNAVDYVRKMGFIVSKHPILRVIVLLILFLSFTGAVNFIDASLPNGNVDTPYNYNLRNLVFNATQPYNFVLLNGTLPTGITLSSNGYLNGVPSESGNYQFIINVSDATGNSSIQDFGVAVGNPLFDLDLNDRLTIVMLFLMFLASAILLYFGQYLFSGVILIILGFLLLFNQFNIIISYLFIAGGLAILFIVND